MADLILCACKKGNKIDKEVLAKWKDLLHKKSIAYTYVDDLCGLAAKGKIDLSNTSSDSKSVVIGCQPKAMKNLLERAGMNTPKNSIEFYHINKASLEILDNKNLNKGEVKEIPYTNDWKPWYPVLDYDLCTSCQKCLNFCLFGVYTLTEEGKVVVTNPENCKDLCPACARTCPTSAIVFPKHHESPIDGGDGEFKPDSGNLLSEIQNDKDVYQLLANRRKASGVSLINTDQLKLAKDEREKFKKNDGSKDQKDE